MGSGKYRQTRSEFYEKRERGEDGDQSCLSLPIVEEEGKEEEDEKRFRKRGGGGGGQGAGGRVSRLEGWKTRDFSLCVLHHIQGWIQQRSAREAKETKDGILTRKISPPGCCVYFPSSMYIHMGTPFLGGGWNQEEVEIRVLSGNTEKETSRKERKNRKETKREG